MKKTKALPKQYQKLRKRYEAVLDHWFSKCISSPELGG